MEQEKLKKIIELNKLYVETEGEEGDRAILVNADMRDADMRDADMRYADMQNADMQNADMRDADMRDADMRYANMRHANMRYANMRHADMRYANMQNANMRDADMQNADMRYADMRNADFDFSAFPLWCGSFDIKVDQRLPFQLAYHICRMVSDDPEVQRMQGLLKEFANKSHLIDTHDVKRIE